jgi:hypothetical protein
MNNLYQFDCWNSTPYFSIGARRYRIYQLNGIGKGSLMMGNYFIGSGFAGK